jgi:hypothetical protein
MKTRMNSLLSIRLLGALILILVTVLALVPASAAAGLGYTVKIENASIYDIYHIYMSPVGYTIWGPDLLGSNILYTNYTFTQPGLAAGHYDLKLVDEDGDSCVVPNVAVYGDTNWRITNSWLLNCEFH